jgi:ankyrin repeat protein
MNGHAKVVKALLVKGTDVHAKTSAGETPLHKACMNGHNDIAAMLGRHGTVRSTRQRTPSMDHF